MVGPHEHLVRIRVIPTYALRANSALKNRSHKLFLEKMLNINLLSFSFSRPLRGLEPRYLEHTVTNHAPKRPTSVGDGPFKNFCSVRLVGFGIRLWTSECKTGEIGYWVKASQLYTDVLGDRSASTAITELSC